MFKSIFSLAPERIQFEEFRNLILRRNRWLIMLRFGAVAMLLTLIIGIYAVEQFFPKFYIESLPIWLITISILIYNYIFLNIWQKISNLTVEKNHFKGLHFSLLQICTDFAALSLLVYFTGGVESPINAFYIFHVIIGSLLLPGIIISFIISTVIIISIAYSLASMFGIIPHHGIQGLLPVPLYNNPDYLIIFFVFLTGGLFISIYLANSIAKELYSRERSLTQAYNELENAEKAKSRYVMTIVHDLKTPIAAVMTYLNNILDRTHGEINPEQLRPLERSKLRLGNAINTINDILYLSQVKLESGIENITNVNLVALFEEIYDELRVIMRSKNLEYSFLHEEKEKISIQAEPKLLKLALANLVSNACKYTGENGKIEIVLNSLSDSIILSVADNGIGIPEKDQSKVFEDFYRTSISKKLGTEGTGLGMSILMHILKMYHGEIKIKSPSYLSMGDDKPGTQFIISLPKVFSKI